MSSIVKLRPSSYLSVPRHTLIESLCNTKHSNVRNQMTASEQNDWRYFTRAMAFIVNCSYASVAEAMLKQTWEEEKLVKHARDGGEHARLEQQRLSGQLRYMARLMRLVAAAQYMPLGNEHWQWGVKMDNYSSGQHVEVDETLLENKLFGKYFDDPGGDGGPYWIGPDSEDKENVPYPEFARYVLIFFRGTCLITEEGLYVWEKLRYLFDYICDSVTSLWRFVRRDYMPRQRKDPSIHSIFGFDQSDSVAGSASIHGTQALKRVTVETVLDEHWKQGGWWFSKLFSTLELQEPAFQSLLVVYPSPEARTTLKEDEGAAAPGVAAGVAAALAAKGSGRALRLDKKENKPPPKKVSAPKAPVESDRSEEDSSEVSRVLRVEMFERIPFRDLGLVIPERSINLGLKHKLRFAIQLLGILLFIVLCISQLELRNTARNWIFLSFLLSRLVSAFDIAHSLSRMQAGLTAAANDWLDQRRIASNNPCIARLMKQVEEQELKEIFLGYYFLWKKGPLTKRQLDMEVETFLMEEHKLNLDFDVEDALTKLVHLKLIEETGGKYRCIRRPKEYLDDPRPRWLEFFHSFGDTGDDAEQIYRGGGGRPATTTISGSGQFGAMRHRRQPSGGGDLGSQASPDHSFGSSVAGTGRSMTGHSGPHASFAASPSRTSINRRDY